MANKKRASELPTFLKLSENETKKLLHLSSVITLNPGRLLLKGKPEPHVIYLILSGKIMFAETMGSKSKKLKTFKEGNWLSEILYPIGTGTSVSVIAVEESRVVALDLKTISTLEEKTQLHFFKQLILLYRKRVHTTDTILNNLVTKNKRLKADIFNERAQTKTNFRQMEMIRNIIKKIPKLPAFASTLSRKLLEDKISATQIADEVMKDPSLVAIVLKTINSAYYGLEKQVSDMKYAIVMLGFDAVYQLVMAEGVKRTMPDTPTFKELLTHSVIISHLASAISQASDIGDPAELATIGLLHDTGQTVIQLLKEKNPKISMFIDLLDCAQMGALLLKTWNLPDRLWQCVEFQSYPEFSSPENVPEDIQENVAILYFSHLLYDLYRSQPEEELPKTFFLEYLPILRWQGHSLNDISKKILLPELAKNMKKFPTPLRLLLKKHIP